MKDIIIMPVTDLHLGVSLYGKKFQQAHEDLIESVCAIARDEHVDIAVLPGDIYQTNQPSATSQELYFRLVSALSGICKHVIVISGNHDPALLLSATKGVLLPLNVHVCSDETGFKQTSTYSLYFEEFDTGFCAVPFLPEGIVRRIPSGLEAPENRWRMGLAQMFSTGYDLLPKNCRSIAVGHFTVDGAVGFKERQVGDCNMPTDFINNFDFVLMGHIHKKQLLNDKVYYPGTAFPLNFEEASEKHGISVISFSERDFSIKEFPIQEIVKMQVIEGNHLELIEQVQDLVASCLPVWIKAVYHGSKRPTLRKELDDICSGSFAEILCIENRKNIEKAINTLRSGEKLEELSPDDVFLRLMEAKKIEPLEQMKLLRSFKQLVRKVGLQT